MKSTDNKIQKLLLEKNKNNHEASHTIQCEYGVEVKGGKWVDKKDIPNLTKLYQPVYMNEKGVLLYPMTHDLVIGSTGSGKTTVLYDNCIDFYSKLDEKIRPSFLAVDLKGDLYARHAEELINKGYKVDVIDMRNPYFSLRYNPLATIYDDYQESCEIEKSIINGLIGKTFRGVTYNTVAEASKAALARSFQLRDNVDRYINELAEIFIVNTDVKNLSWTIGGRNCLKAIMYTLLLDSEKPEYGMTKKKFTISNVARTAFNNSKDYETIITWLKRAEHLQVVSGALGSVYQLKANVTRDGYVSSMTAELNKYSTRSIEALTSESDISISDVVKGKENHAIFLITDSRSEATNIIAMMFINDLINSLVDEADKNPSRSLDKDFIILADEMGNMPALPGMCNKITTLRSRKIWMHMSIQTFEQLVFVYNKEIAATILDNCDNHFFFGCNNQDSKEQFAKSLGKKIGVITTASIQGSGVASASMSTGDVPVVKISDLDNLELGEFYVRSRICQSIKSSMIPYFLRTDVERSTKEYKTEYNGYEPNSEVYFIENTLIEDGLYGGKTKKKTPNKSSLMEAIKRIERKEKNNITSAEENEVVNDDNEEFLTDIEKNLPPKTYYTKQAADAGNIARQIYEEIKENYEVDNLDEAIIDIVALGILPTKIQRQLISLNETDQKPALPLLAKDCLSYFKYYLLFDPRLKQNEGKEATLKELQRRIDEIEDLDCFSENTVDAYEEVKDCILKMTPSEFEKYRKKVPNII